jgi:hypothetical protein
MKTKENKRTLGLVVTNNSKKFTYSKFASITAANLKNSQKIQKQFANVLFFSNFINNHFPQMIIYADGHCLTHSTKFHRTRLKLVLYIAKITGCFLTVINHIRIEKIIQDLNRSKPVITYCKTINSNSQITIPVAEEEKKQLLLILQELGLKKGYLMSKQDAPNVKLHETSIGKCINNFLIDYCKEKKLGFYLTSGIFRYVKLIDEHTANNNL